MPLLYKYTTIESALKMLKTSSIGFSCAENLNDPFELGGASYNLSGVDGTYGVKNNLSSKFGILSLTRSPLNSIMWSHYSNEHRGTVIEIDPSIAGLDVKSLIPSSNGNVVYSRTHPNNKFKNDDCGFSDIHRFCTKHFQQDLTEKEKELAHMFFLHKSDFWHHEEEVRVVKNIENSGGHHSNQEKAYTNKSGNWNKIYLDKSRPLHCLEIPKGSVTKIYLGASVGKHFGSDTKGHQDMVLKFMEYDVDVSSIKAKKKSWELEHGVDYGADGNRIIT
jgi:hypothetical protein